MTRIREEKHQSTVLTTALTVLNRHHVSSRNKLYITLPNNQSRICPHLNYMILRHHISPCSASCTGSMCCSVLCSRLRLSSIPVLVWQRPGLPGRRLSARRRCPCQTTAFCRHSNTRCQSDAQQFWRQDLCRRRTTSPDLWSCGGNSLPPNLKTMWSVIQPLQAVTEDIIIWIV